MPRGMKYMIYNNNAYNDLRSIQ